uniref:Uncharacterized protein n=1 Tax=Timema monikensis TaxID=170555 RepID=A0A7R9DY86_9NEOP|nr:unnamed protein product [Timema monikensis]
MDGKEEARILQLLDDTLSSDDSSNNSEQDNDKDSIYMPASNSSDSDSDEVENVYDELVSDLHSLQPISTSSYCQSEVVQEEVGTSISTTGIDFPNKVVGLLDDMSTGFTNTDIDSQSEVVIDEVGVSIATNGIDTQSEVVLEEMIIITDSIDYQSEVVVEEVGNVIFDIQANPSNMLTDNECEVVEETISLELTRMGKTFPLVEQEQSVTAPPLDLFLLPAPFCHSDSIRTYSQPSFFSTTSTAPLSVTETRNKLTPDLLQSVFDPWTSDKKEQLLSSVRNSKVQHKIDMLDHLASEADSIKVKLEKFKMDLIREDQVWMPALPTWAVTPMAVPREINIPYGDPDNPEGAKTQETRLAFATNRVYSLGS